jgi:hypothetical protein
MGKRPVAAPQRSPVVAAAALLLLACSSAATQQQSRTITRRTFLCIPGPGAEGGPPPPPPNATCCVGGCAWNGSDCIMRSPFKQLLFEDDFEGSSVNSSSWGVWDYRTTMDPGRVRTNAAHDMVRPCP